MAVQSFDHRRSSQEICSSATSFVTNRLYYSQYPIVLSTSTCQCSTRAAFISDPLIHVSSPLLVRGTMAAAADGRRTDAYHFISSQAEAKPEAKQWTCIWTSRRSCTVAMSVAYGDQRCWKPRKPRRRKPGHKESQQAHPYCQSPCL